MIEIEVLKKEFTEKFAESKNSPTHFFFSPGRVNLIGEHIDYLGGLVLPVTIPLGICAAVKYRKDSIVKIASYGMPDVMNIDISKPILPSKTRWMNYPSGVIHELIKEGKKISGFEAFFHADLPAGSGLSSSAAIEVLTAVIALYPLNEGKIDVRWTASLCREAEIKFAGVQCGIMDQFVVAGAKKGHALLLNSSTLEYKYVPFNLKNHSLVVIDSGKKRELGESRYNQRRNECQQAFEIIRKHRNIEKLVDASLEDVETLLEDPVLKKRARHAVTENERVKTAVHALENEDVTLLGSIMIKSHLSLREDFEVTCFELDTIFHAFLNLAGCAGGRMTGAGFGGCLIAIVEKEKIDDFISEVQTAVQSKLSTNPVIYVCSPSGSASILKIE